MRPIDADAVCERCRKSGAICTGSGCEIPTMPTIPPPNEPLTQEDIDKMHFDRVWIDYGLDDSGERCGEDGVILYGKLYSIDTLDGSAFEDLLLNSCDGETLGRPGGDYTVYRRPPEGKEDT